MKDLAILMPCWKSPELLKVSIPSLLKSTKSKYEIIVILNEADPESIMYLDELKIKHINLEDNIGPSAVDYAIPYIKENNFQYIANVNSDMIFSDHWDTKLIKELKDNYPCSTSSTLIEPSHNGFKFNFFSELCHLYFNEFLLQHPQAEIEEDFYWGHPILCKTDDFLSVNGYSDNLDKKWIENNGRALDGYFAYRLFILHNKKFRFIKVKNSFVYHAISLNTNKYDIPKKSNGPKLFEEITKINASKFEEYLKNNTIK